MAGRILFVENMDKTRLITHRMLTKMGYEVTSVNSADEALEVLDQGQEFEVLFTDIKMPGSMDGLGLAVEVKKRFPNIIILFTSGLTALSDEELITLSAHFISKPYLRKELADKLGAIINA